MFISFFVSMLVSLFSLFVTYASSHQISQKTCDPSATDKSIELPTILISPLSSAIDDEKDYEEKPSSHLNKPNSNSSLLTFKDCEVHVEFICSASYPVEWVEITHKNVDATGRPHGIYEILWAWTDHVVHFNETDLTSQYGSPMLPPPFSFSGASISKYNTSVALLSHSNSNVFQCISANYSCRSSGNPCIQSNVIGVVDQFQRTIKYQRSNELIYAEATDFEDDGKCEVMISFVLKDNGRFGWKCTGLKGQELLPSGRTCDSAMHCNSFFPQQRRQNCVKHLPSDELCVGCGFVNVSMGVKPGFAVCKDRNGSIVSTFHYFFSVPQHDHFIQNSVFPKMHLNWNDADPNDMLFLEPLEEEEYFVGEILNISCSISRYYFAYGHRFAFELKNRTVYYSKAIDGEHDHTYNTNLMQLEIILDDSNLAKIYCVAPVWNSTEWVNKSTTITVREDGAPPTLELISSSGSNYLNKGEHGEMNVAIALHETNQSIKCVGRGRPAPEVNWVSMDNEKSTVGVEVLDEGADVKSLVFRYMTFTNRGRLLRFQCEAENFLGRCTAFVNVRITDDTAIFMKLSAAFIFALIIVFGIILSLCWSKIQKQRKQLRHLTEEEIREFRHGNLDMIENAAYLDSEQSLQALPYNDEFEIPLRRLFIDTSQLLGSGNFGQVFKGLILESNGQRDMLEVAVKTAKPRFCVAYFKALLSEVKIMSHIGRHPNVVCLVGACTENIRKREIYMAVEFCAKGSLEQFLKQSRISFVNLISNDTIYIDPPFWEEFCKYQNVCEKSTTLPLVEHVEDANGTSVSTVHLLRFAREIANGMDFLGSKKVIHGDLAARNVLLTHELVAKIGDFGLSRQLMEYSNYVRSTDDDYELPWKWMSYEVLQDGKFSPQADAWSYGVTLWEIFSLGQHPYAGISWSPNFIVHLQDGLRLHKPPYATSHLYNLMLDCWAIEASDRPTFMELKDVFEGLLMYSCSNDYFKPDPSKYRTTNHYINRSANFPVHNPGYSLFSTKNSFMELREPAKEESVSSLLLIDQAKGKVRFSNGISNISNKTKTPSNATEDTHGYLKPLMISCDEEE